ncbi:MAG: flavodoxin domain-containing protein, partial [Planctomycetota bacterium]
RHESEKGVVVAYGSMYGNTEKMMEASVRGIAETGLQTIRIHNVSKAHNSFILRDIWRYKGLILGSPTYDGKLFPPMESLVCLLRDKMIKKRCVGIFGNYGWSGGGSSRSMILWDKQNYSLSSLSLKLGLHRRLNNLNSVLDSEPILHPQ